MHYKIIIRTLAFKDIDNIGDYIYRFSFSREVAKNTKDIILGAIFPKSFGKI